MKIIKNRLTNNLAWLSRRGMLWEESNFGLLCPEMSQTSRNVPKYFKSRLGLRAHAHTCARGQFEFWTVKSVIFPSKEPLCA